MKRILVVYYTQTGQLKSLIDSILKDIDDDSGYQLDYYEIKPVQAYPFPWTYDEFFDVMPESVLGIPTPIESFDIKDDYDLVVLGYQPWFLSPSIPFWSLLEERGFQSFIKGKNVLTVVGIRNMWVNAHKLVHEKLKKLGTNYIGNIVLADPNTNLVSVLTVAKYMMTGRKKPYKALPAYGILDSDISEAKKYGILIKESISKDSFDELQPKIFKEGGVFSNFPLTVTELSAGRIFSVWARFVLKKGPSKDLKRRLRLRIYKVYLLSLLFIVSPFTSLLFFIFHLLFYPLTRKFLKKIALLK